MCVCSTVSNKVSEAYVTHPCSLDVHGMRERDILQEKEKRLQSIMFLLRLALTSPKRKTYRIGNHSN